MARKGETPFGKRRFVLRLVQGLLSIFIPLDWGDLAIDNGLGRQDIT